MKKKGLKKLFVGNQSAPSRYYRKCQIQMFSLCVREWDRFLRYNDISNRLLFKISKVSNKSLKSSSTVEHTTVVWINWIKKKFIKVKGDCWEKFFDLLSLRDIFAMSQRFTFNYKLKQEKKNCIPHLLFIVNFIILNYKRFCHFEFLNFRKLVK